MRRIHSRPPALFVWGLLGLSVLTVHAQPEVKAYFFDPDQIGRGQTVKVHIAGDKLAGIESVRFEPSTGITVGAIREVEPMRKAQCWAVEITADKDAPLGRRAVTAVTRNGIVKKRIDVIATPIPIISDMKMLEASSGSVMTVISFTFQAEHAEGALGKKQELALGVASSGFQLLPGFSYYRVNTNTIEPIDPTHSLVTVRWTPMGRTLTPGLVVRVAMKDNHKGWSNMLETVTPLR